MEYNEFNLNKEREIMNLGIIGEIVRVSNKSRSKAAGKLVEVVSIQLKEGVKDEDSEVKVRIIPSFGTQETKFAYVRAKFLETPVSSAFASREKVESTEHNVQFKWALCKGVEFQTDKEFDFIDEYGYPSKTDTMCGFISDQWVEDGEKLYNIVFLGDFRVVKESEITCYVSPRKA
ncbi:MotB-like transcriptional regulator [Shigella phage Shf125875]|uniref:Transcription factor MotB n=1 Tax=Shigella phage Shf125875 TaxID=1541825 RepID=A0A088FQY8_9CAUD|nr:MotB-like transcriptional regulator [Shigella phage Shf125875]AIM50593.1 transcription factor MotB [Shigella phage Shf125875]